MIRVARASVAAAVLALVLVVPTPPAGACSCAAAPVATHLRDASVVFVGRAGSSRAQEAGVTTRFSVEVVYKGAPPARVDVSAPSDAATCGVPFAERRRYVVFAKDAAGSLTTSLCAGTSDDLASVSGLTPVAVRSSVPETLPRRGGATTARSTAIAVAGLLVAMVAAAAALAVRATRRPRPIA